MSSIADFLAKQLFIEKSVVTYRSLSRQFKIHVNAAKNELAAYHASPQSSAEKSYATYIISGDIVPQSSQPALSQEEGDAMDVDQPLERGEGDDEESEIIDSEPVPQIKITLVGERDVERVKSKYARIYSEHIYCLSPSPLIDPALICDPSSEVYSTDAKLTAEQQTQLGRIISPDVNIGKVQPTTGKDKTPIAASRSKKPGLRASASMASVKEETKPVKSKAEEKKKEPEKEEVKSPSPAVSKPKPTGKLDWSKAKPKGKGSEKQKEKVKESKVPEVKLEDLEPKVKVGPPTKSKKQTTEGSKHVSSKKTAKPESHSSAASSSDVPKRGIKRKSALPVDSESESAGPSRSTSPPRNSKANAKQVKVKKGIILSDEEEEDDNDESIGRSKGKKTASAKVDKSLRAMMDMDDDLVIKHSRRATSPPPSSDGEKTEQADEDVEMEEEPEEEVKPVPKKKRAKKVVPVGRNGLKKRRVVKSRMTTDEKGYMVTEDYSEYESVDEEESEKEPKPRAKKSTAKGKKTDSMSDLKTSTTTSKAKTGSTTSKSKKAGSLMNFFGKK